MLVPVCAIKSWVLSGWEACYQDLAIGVRFGAERFEDKGGCYQDDRWEWMV